MSPPRSPRDKFMDNQDILKFDINTYFNNFILPIDQLRSRFNALIPDAEYTGANGFQESRCHTFYRMIGFPILANEGGFYSPGFDINANLDSSILEKRNGIKKLFEKNEILTNISRQRERTPIVYNKVFSDGGFKSTALAIGSINIRSFIDQFGDISQLELDNKQNQNIQERNIAIIENFINDFPESVSDLQKTGLLVSSHILKPFIVDPRIDDGVKPARNRIAAPFLINKSQLKIFQGKNSEFGTLKRPFIERVINIRFNNKNQISDKLSDKINETLDKIKQDGNILDQTLLASSNKPTDQLFNSDLVVFDNYFKLIRKVISVLVFSIKKIKTIKSKINFLPIPDQRFGLENIGKLQEPIENDSNNRDLEKEILKNQKLKILSDINASTDSGLDGVVDSGDFVFSNVDDMVFVANKATEKSYQDNLDKLLSMRNQFGKQGLEALKIIEIIMGEFSGIGLIDIIAIQAAFWLMDPQKLICIIDEHAFERAKIRKNLNLPSSQSDSVISALKEFETKLKIVYNIIQLYYNQTMNGSIFKVF